MKEVKDILNNLDHPLTTSILDINGSVEPVKDAEVENEAVIDEKYQVG